MWNCERTRTTGESELIEDATIGFQPGSEPDRFGASQCDIAHLKTKDGESLGSLAIGILSNVIKVHDDGFEVFGALVDTSKNGHVENYHHVGESWRMRLALDE